MNKILSFLTVIISVLFSNTEILPQVVTGKLVDEHGVGLSGIYLQLYISPDVYNSISLSDGSFYLSSTTEVKVDGALPSGYSITNNFPNPFNPSTRIGLTLPKDGNVKVGVYNILGQRVTDEIDRYFSAGTHSVDIELEGLPSGIYIARISIDEKYTVAKKMMLIYGSQHLSLTASTFSIQLNKSNNKSSLLTDIDSLVAKSSIIGRKTFTSLPGIVGDTLYLGELTIERYCPDLPTVLYEGKTYNTVLIGSQCWLQENLDVGTMIYNTSSGFLQTNNGMIEKYCYDNNPANCEIYGGLYEGPEAMQYVTTEGAQGICPEGWHISTYAEFTTLAETVNWDGNALKELGEGVDAGAGTNTSGFSALLAGYRSFLGYFNHLGYDAYFWSSTKDASPTIYALQLWYTVSGIDLSICSAGAGFSVRCVKD